eukprot:CAMPEP_0169284434 /NCGR_PEP_ID=MMETSP1016-20121227/58110_1 /TAXON_ID=342587 /ORGANISM="Karlodinium micrum, Strain CCMP2283" /LENGTH=132 /DNA_ID=CAMNT_0009373769 /DNA_START=374 /DNA_END=769 /DNA_ORIENTATION=+
MTKRDLTSASELAWRSVRVIGAPMANTRNKKSLSDRRPGMFESTGKPLSISESRLAPKPTAPPDFAASLSKGRSLWRTIDAKFCVCSSKVHICRNSTCGAPGASTENCFKSVSDKKPRLKRSRALNITSSRC